ncbi:MAG: hypothetical protein NTV46_15905 [Verrucomicrobia bacterium]|nr:hypothetical protein [Verrucomicrobiota bacterium]
MPPQKKFLVIGPDFAAAKIPDDPQARNLGDMRSVNYVMDITPDFEEVQYRVRKSQRSWSILLQTVPGASRSAPDISSPWRNANRRDGSAELAERACRP